MVRAEVKIDLDEVVLSHTNVMGEPGRGVVLIHGTFGQVCADTPEELAEYVKQWWKYILEAKVPMTDRFENIRSTQLYARHRAMLGKEEK